MITAVFRTMILYLVLTVGMRLMGKRQIGELEPSELVVTMTLSDLASVPMQNFGIPLINGLFPITILLSLSMLLSCFNLKSIRFRTLLCGTPVVIVRNGVPVQSAMRQNRLTIDELYEQLRGDGISRLTDVKYAVLETSGKLSIFPYPDVTEEEPTLPRLLICDGRVLQKTMKASGVSDQWLQATLRQHNIASPRDVFLLTIDEKKDVHLVPREVTP